MELHLNDGGCLMSPVMATLRDSNNMEVADGDVG